MAHPPLTLDGIRPYLTPNIDNVLAQRYTNEDIPLFFSEQGISTNTPDKGNCNIQMRWIRDVQNNVTGIFYRILFPNNRLTAWTPINHPPINQINQISIKENVTKLTHNPVSPKGVRNILNGRRIAPVEIPFNINQIDNIEALREFFARNPELLPTNLRERVFPQDDPQRQENDEPIDYKLLIGSLLAFAVISYIAIKILHEPPKVEVK